MLNARRSFHGCNLLRIRCFRSSSNSPELACSTTTSVHASAECMLYEDTDSTILLCRKRKRKQQPQASSVEGYRQRCIECINTPVACFCFSSDTKVHTAANANECLSMHFSFFPLRSGKQFNMPEGSEDDERRPWCATDTHHSECRGKRNYRSVKRLPRNSDRIRVRHVSACVSDVAVCRPSC